MLTSAHPRAFFDPKKIGNCLLLMFFGQQGRFLKADSFKNPLGYLS